MYRVFETTSNKCQYHGNDANVARRILVEIKMNGKAGFCVMIDGDSSRIWTV